MMPDEFMFAGRLWRRGPDGLYTTAREIILTDCESCHGNHLALEIMQASDEGLSRMMMESLPVGQA